MGVQISIRDRVENIPGVYPSSNFLSSPVIAATGVGNVVLIDTGLNRGYGGLSGIRGVHRKGKNAIYRFNSYGEFADYVNGGPLQVIANRLFAPGGGNTGASSLIFARACTTTPSSTSTYSLTTGSFSFQTLDEGLYANSAYRDLVSPTATLTVATLGTAFAADQNLIQAGATVTIRAAVGSSQYVLAHAVLRSDYRTGTLDELRSRFLDEIRGGVRLGTTIGPDVAGTDQITAQINVPLFSGFTTEELGRRVTLSLSITNPIRVPISAGNHGVSVGGLQDGVSPQMTTNLVSGYAVEGTQADTGDGFTFSFWKGTYGGTDEAISVNEDEVAEVRGLGRAFSDPIEVVRTPVFNTIEELHAWALEDTTFQQYFRIRGVTVNSGSENTSLIGDDDVDTEANVAAITGIESFAGGTEDYNTDDFDRVLIALEGEDIDFILYEPNRLPAYLPSTVPDDDPRRIPNVGTVAKIEAAVRTRYGDLPTVYVAGHDDDLEKSKVESALHNSGALKLVHSGVRQQSTGAARRDKDYTSFYHAALVCGMDAGREPQQGLTFQQIPVRGLLHNPTKDEERQAIDAGIFIVRQEGNAFFSVADVNTLQANRAVYARNSSYLAPVRKIKRAIEKGLTNLFSNRFQKGNTASNIATVSTADVVSAGTTELQSYLIEPGVDNYLVTFRNVRAVRQGPIIRFLFTAEFNIPQHFILINMDVEA